MHRRLERDGCQLAGSSRVLDGVLACRIPYYYFGYGTAQEIKYLGKDFTDRCGQRCVRSSITAGHRLCA